MDLEWLHEEGFEGFISFSDVARGRVTTSIGVYAVVRESTDGPAFTIPGTGRPGSNYSLEKLQDAWVPGAHILYPGKADCAEGLLERLTKYQRFGKGKRSGHSGGRAIWQLADAADLKICWLATPGQGPERVESAFIKDFKDRHHQMRPFANPNDGKKSS